MGRLHSRVGPALLLAALAFSAPPAGAAVFDGPTWPTGADGYTIVPVCIDAASSATQTSSGASASLNPSLDDVVGQLCDALREGWEASSSVRFVGFFQCTEWEWRDSVRLYVHKNAANQTRTGDEGRD